jgi:hypothetical protein
MLVDALLAIAAACSSEVGSPTEDALAVVDDALGPFESLGELHNAYLDYVAPRIKATPLAARADFFRAECVAFVRLHGIRREAECNVDFEAVKQRRKAARDRRNGGDVSASPEQLEFVYMDALINLPYTCSGCSVSSFNSQANAIYADAQADPDITTSELSTLQGHVSVAKSSYQYWKSQSNWQPYVDAEPEVPNAAGLLVGDGAMWPGWDLFWGCVWTDGLSLTASLDIAGSWTGVGAGAASAFGAGASVGGCAGMEAPE